jgi:hypothetical protein
VSEEVVHHAGLRVDGGLHLRLHMCKVIHPSSEREPEPQLDGPDESAHFTPLNNFFILHNTCNNNTQQEVPITLGVSISVSRTGGRKQNVV